MNLPTRENPQPLTGQGTRPEYRLNCLVIGAARSGTTTLYEGLRRHPEIFMSPNKEPGYFRHVPTPEHNTGPGDDAPVRRGITRREDYDALFAEVQHESVIGEASVVYLGSEAARRAIHTHVPDARLIVMLRNPTERAYSQYSQHVQQGREPLETFAEAITAEPERLAAGWSPFWGYVEMGFYARHLRHYLDGFPRQQIGIFLYDDLVEGTTQLIQHVYAFLGVDPSFDPKLADNINASGAPRSSTLHRFLTGSNSVKRALKPIVPYRLRVAARNAQTGLANRNLVSASPITESVRQQLTALYHDDVRDLEQIIGRDLSHWLSAGSDR